MKKPFRLKRGYYIGFSYGEVEPFSYSWWVNAYIWCLDEYQVWDDITEISNATDEMWDEWERYKLLSDYIKKRIYRKENDWCKL